MKRFVLIAFTALLVGFVAQGQSTDDAYVRVYSLIQQGDAARSSGDSAGALSQYLEAQNALQKLQRVTPDWNTNMVGFRLRYLASHIENLRAAIPAVPGTSAPPAVVPGPRLSSGSGPAVPAPVPDETLAQIRNLQQQLQRLQQDNVLLTAKLKEALAVQPAAVDPRELAKAEQQLRESARDIETLKAALDAEKARPIPAPDNSQIEQLRQVVADSTRKLTDQTQVADNLAQEKAVLQKRIGELVADTGALGALRAENELLKKQVADLNSRPPADKTDELNRQLLQSQAQLARLQSDLEVYRVEKATIEKRVADLQAQAPPDKSGELDRILRLEQERATLARERDAARQQATNAVSELAALRAQTAPGAAAGSVRNPQFEEQLKNVQLERDLLDRRLASAQDALIAATSTTTAPDSTRVKKLKQERDDLRKKFELAQTELNNRKPVAGTSAEHLKQLQDERDAALRQKDTLQQQLEIALSDLKRERSKPAGATLEERDRMRTLEQERDMLKQQLAAALKGSTGTADPDVSTRINAMANQLAGLRARLDAYEAKAVPYSAEELALFKQAAPGVAAFQLSATLSTPGPATESPPPAARRTSREAPANARSLILDGQRAFAAKGYEEAEQKYLEALKLDERSVFVLANLGAIELELNRLPDAEKHLQQAAALDPEDAFSLTVLGYLRFQQQRYDEAVDNLSRAGKLDPKRADTQNYLGIALGQKGLRGPAEAALRRAITIDPAYGSAHNNLAVIYIAQKPPMVELARWHYEKALAAGHPRNPDLEKMLETNGAVVPK